MLSKGNVILSMLQICILFILTGCCTKKACSYDTIESFVISASKSMRAEVICLDKITFAHIDSTDINLRENSTDTSKYSCEVDRGYFHHLPQELSYYSYVIKLKTGDSVFVDTLKSINYEKIAVRSECNQCLLGKDYVEGFVYANYVLTTSKLGKVYGQELKY